MAIATELAALSGLDLGRRRCSYRERDVILFALAVGARADELRWVYEQRLEAMPTFALALGLWAVRAAGATGAYDPVRTLHVGQDLRLHRPLPPEGEVELEAKVGAVWDKGSAALVEVVVGCALFDATYTIFVIGGGGFGGERGPSRPPAELGEPGLSAQVQTTSEQAALYRLTGDPHPVHIDPEVARASGFERPILHGLCTLAAVTKTVAEAVDADLGALSRLSARLSGPVYPGDAIAVEVWERDPGEFAFRAGARGAAVLDAGEVDFHLEAG